MGPERLFLAVFLAAGNILLAVVIITVNWRAANGRLERNQRTGIRTRSTMRSDQAWTIGHRAALRLTPLYLIVLAGTLVALFVAMLHASAKAINLAGIGGALAWVAVVALSGIVAGRAAKSADDQADGGQATMLTDQAQNSQYPKAIHFYAGLNGLLLVVVCAGLWLLAARSSSNGIPPNASVGFRDQHTLASVPGWYAAQRVGFHVAALADTIVTAVVFAILAVAYSRRFNPIWIVIVPVIGGLAIAVCVMIAGHQADRAAISVARAVLPGAGHN